MTALAVVALILASVIGTYVIWTLNEPAVRATVTFADRIRYILGFFFLGLMAWHLVNSGNPVYVFAAVIGVMFITGYALMEKPWSDTI